MATYIDINDLIGYVGPLANDTFRYSKTHGLSVIGNPELVQLANLLLEDIATSYSHTHATTNNSGDYMEFLHDKMVTLRNNLDNGLVGIAQWYNFVDTHLNLPLANIVSDHCKQYGAVSSIETFSQAPNVWLIR